MKTEVKEFRKLVKQYRKLSADCGGFADKYDYKKADEIVKTIDRLVNSFDVKELPKTDILDLIDIQSKERFLPPHRFYMLFTK